ncbi:MAG: CPBP family intramembrane metalloprotease [Clostridia bacterium]|nr:CPBP family intramembrane metalloprotease [Clostridia bacterium]
MSKKEDLMKEFGEAEMRSNFKAPVKPIIMQQSSGLHDDLEGKKESDLTAEPSEGQASETAHTHSSHKHSSSHHGKKKHRFFRAVVNVFSDRTFCKMLNAFLFCLIVNAFEYFFLINQKNIQTRGAISKIFGVIILFIFMYSARLKPKNLGLPPDPRAIISALKKAIFFSLAFIPAYLIDILIVLIKGGSPRLTVFAYNQPHSSVGFVDWAANILLLIVISALSSFMLEFLFRGVILRMGRAKFGFVQTAFIVSIFYFIWYLIVPLSKITRIPLGRLIPLCLFYLVFEFFLSFKWCLCVRATGSIWLAIFDHFFFITITGVLRVVNTAEGVSNYIDVNKYWRYVIFQAISFALCYMFYKKRMLLRKKKQSARGSRSTFVFDSLADMVPEDINSDRKQPLSVDESKLDENYKKYLDSTQTSDSHHK